MSDLPSQVTNYKIKCPFCSDDFDSNELNQDFEFKEVPNLDNPGWLCCNLCWGRLEQIEDVEEFNDDYY